MRFSFGRRASCFAIPRPWSILTRPGAEYDNSSVGEEEKFSMQHVKSAVLDWQVREAWVITPEYSDLPGVGLDADHGVLRHSRASYVPVSFLIPLHLIRSGTSLWYIALPPVSVIHTIAFTQVTHLGGHRSIING